MNDFQVRPKLPPARPEGFKAPPTPNQNTAAPVYNSALVRPPPKGPVEDSGYPYAYRNAPNDFGGHPQSNMRLVGWREPYQVVPPGGTLDILNYSYFVLRSVGSSDFICNVPTPPMMADLTGATVREAWGVTVDIEYAGAGKPIFPGVALPNANEEPSWTSAPGHLDTVVLTWAERWLLRVSSFGYQI